MEMRWRWPPENWCGNFSTSDAARPTDSSSSATRALRPSSPPTSPCSRSGSPTISSTFQRGFRLAYGSWKIICMRRRSARGSGVVAVSWPSKCTLPRVGAYRPTSRRATVLLPQPDSPTSASVSPLRMLNETPSTACTNWRGLRSTTRFSQGAETSKTLARSRTSTSGPAEETPAVVPPTGLVSCCALTGIPPCCALRYSPLGRPGGLMPSLPPASRRRGSGRRPSGRGGPRGSGPSRWGSAG